MEGGWLSLEEFEENAENDMRRKKELTEMLTN